MKAIKCQFRCVIKKVQGDAKKGGNNSLINYKINNNNNNNNKNRTLGPKLCGQLWILNKAIRFHIHSSPLFSLTQNHTPCHLLK